MHLLVLLLHRLVIFAVLVIVLTVLLGRRWFPTVFPTLYSGLLFSVLFSSLRLLGLSHVVLGLIVGLLGLRNLFPLSLRLKLRRHQKVVRHLKPEESLFFALAAVLLSRVRRD